MGADISTRNISSQPKIFPLEIINATNALVNCGMGKKPPRETETLQLKAWFKACGAKQKDAVKATGYSQSYFSNLARGEKGDPSADFVRKLAVFLKVGMDDLYGAPPPQNQIPALQRVWTLARAATQAPPRERKKKRAS